MKLMPTKDLPSIMKDVNKAPPRIKITCIEKANQFAYSTAVVITEKLNIKLRNPKSKSNAIPKWKIRLEIKIKKIRSDVNNLKKMKEQNLKNVKYKISLIKKIVLAQEKWKKSIFRNLKGANNSKSVEH